MGRARMRVGLLFALASFLAWGVIEPSATLAYSPIPAFPGVGGVAVSEAAFDAEALHTSLSAFQSRVGAKYSVLVVEYSDRENRAGSDYGDADQQFIGSVVNAWGPSMDRESSVIIVLALSNHDVIVHPFSRFASLGWEGEAVKATIDASPFALYARSGDYAQGVITLVTAIDSELEGRIARAESLRTSTTRTLAAARLSLARFEQASVGSPFAGARSRAKGDRLLAAIHAAESAMARAELDRLPGLARDVSVKARELDGYFELQAGMIERDQRAVARARAEQRSLERHPLARSDAESARALDRAARAIDAARAATRDFDPERAGVFLDRASSAQAAARVAEYRAAYRRRLTHEVLPVVLVVLAFAFVLRRLFVRAQESRRIVAEARERLAALDAALGVAGEKLLALENEHALFLSGGSAASDFEGASREPVRDAAARTDELFLAFEAATRLSREARAKLDGVGSIGLSAAKSALAALTTEPFVVRTEQVKVRKLLLPDSREIRMTLPELLVELESAYARASGLLEVLGVRIGEIHEQVDGLASVVARAEDSFEEAARRVKIGSFAARVKALDDARLAIVASSRLDPLGAVDRIAAFRETAGALVALADGLVDVAKTVRDTVPTSLDASMKRVADLRAAGRKLAEPGFDPDAIVARAKLACRSVLRSLESGELENAVEESRRVRDAAADLEADLGASELARTTYVGRISDDRARLEPLEKRIVERRARVEALRAVYSDDSLGDVLDNAQEADVALSRARTLLAEAEHGLREDTQAYLGAKRAADEAHEAIDSVETLFFAIDGKASELASALVEVDADRKAAAERLALARADSDAIAALGVPRGVALEPIAEELEALAALRDETPTPVRSLATRSDALLVRADEARAFFAARRATIDERRRVREQVGEMVRTLGGSLANSRDDGPEANAIFEQAKARFAAVRDAPLDDGLDLIDSELRAIAEAVESARTKASLDFESAREARAALAKAHEAVRETSAKLSMVDSFRLVPLRAELEAVQQLISSASYQLAKTRAESVEKRALAVVDDIRRDQEFYAERRRRRAETFASDSIFRDSSSHRPASGRSIFGPTDWNGSTSSSSSSDSGWSWGSSSSHSSHRSHHSSSSSSSSGSSSYGSSSGRSSYGSSSGRSKW